MIKEFIFKTENDYLKRIVSDISACLQHHLQNHDHVILAVSGGKSPVNLFEKLSFLDADWQRIIITLVDERCVASEHLDSNENLVRAVLLKNNASQAQFLPIYTADSDIWGTDLSQKNQVFADLTAKYPLITILGMGEDGHTASLFPTSPQIEHGLTTQDFFCWQTAPNVPEHRLSFSLSSILKSQQIFLPLSGENKISIYQKARSEPSPYPIRHVLNEKVPVKVFLVNKN